MDVQFEMHIDRFSTHRYWGLSKSKYKEWNENQKNNKACLCWPQFVHVFESGTLYRHPAGFWIVWIPGGLPMWTCSWNMHNPCCQLRLISAYSQIINALFLTFPASHLTTSFSFHVKPESYSKCESCQGMNQIKTKKNKLLTYYIAASTTVGRFLHSTKKQIHGV